MASINSLVTAYIESFPYSNISVLFSGCSNSVTLEHLGLLLELRVASSRYLLVLKALGAIPYVFFFLTSLPSRTSRMLSRYSISVNSDYSPLLPLERYGKKQSSHCPLNSADLNPRSLLLCGASSRSGYGLGRRNSYESWDEDRDS